MRESARRTDSESGLLHGLGWSRRLRHRGLLLPGSGFLDRPEATLLEPVGFCGSIWDLEPPDLRGAQREREERLSPRGGAVAAAVVAVRGTWSPGVAIPALAAADGGTLGRLLPTTPLLGLTSPWLRGSGEVWRTERGAACTFDDPAGVSLVPPTWPSWRVGRARRPAPREAEAGGPGSPAAGAALLGCAGEARKVAVALAKLPGAGGRRVAWGGVKPPASGTERVQIGVGTGSGPCP